MVLQLLGCVGRAVLCRSIKSLLKCMPLGEALYDIARDALEEWKKCCDSRQRQREMEELVRMSASDAARSASQAASAVASAPDDREALAGYLNQMPAQARRTLSRPGDMSGLTVPAKLLFDTPDDLVPFIPLRLSALRPGQEVVHAGKSWTLLESIGAGGFGEVWRARENDPPGEDVALKFCLEPTGEALASLRTEADLQMRLGKRRGIVQLRMACLDAGHPFLVFDYIPCGDLVRLIRGWHEKAPTEGLVPGTVRLVRHLAESLADAHELPERVVHRDLKPSNVLLQRGTKPNHVTLLISDFGIGGVSAAQALTRTGGISANESLTTSLVGAHSLLYASPQQKEGGPAHPADDVYALGVIGFQVLLGDTTIEPGASMQRKLRERQIPDNVITVLEDCLASEVEDRLPNARAVVEAIRSL